MKIIKKILKFLFQLCFLFSFGAWAYMCIEIAWRGYTHPTMGILGGLSFVIIGLLNEGYNWNMGLLWQILIGGTTITILEFISGFILNMILGLNIWDYSHIPFNLYGQICLQYSLLWYFLSLIAIFLDDYFRYLIFNEDKPQYHWI